MLKCLDKDPDRRYQSAKELLVDLRRLQLSSSDAPTPPLPRSQRSRRFVYGVAGVLVIVTVLVASNVAGWRDWLFGHPKAPQIRSLAVLPLENRSDDPNQDYFADGITDELITELAKISALRVISRTSIMRYKSPNRSLPEIARALHVDAVVEGSVQRVGDRVRISARLIQGSTDQQLWGRSYERDARDVLTLQKELATAIADEVQIKLTPTERIRFSQAHPVNPPAHEAYLAGRFQWNKRTEEGLKKSIAYFEQAIAKDPEYALAYAGLADAYHLLPELTATTVSDAFPKARTAALKALAIDPSLAEAHSALANIKEDYDWDWKGAEEEYKQAIELGPGQVLAHAWYSNLLLELGRFPEALAQAKTAQQLDPLSVFANDDLSGVLYYAGEYDQAAEQCQKTLSIDPMSAQAHRHLAQVYTEKHLYPEAVSEFQKAIDLSPGGSEALADLGYVFAISGKKHEALQILQTLQSASDPSPYRIAIVYAGLGERDKALQSLQDAVNRRSPGIVHLTVSPLFRVLQSDYRFQELQTYIGLKAKAGGASHN